MATDLAQLDSDRIARFLRNRLGEHTWRVGEAKAKLTQIMKEAKSGRPQLVGVRKPVVMVGLEELEELVLKLREPETWGECFSTHFDDAEDNIDLTSPSQPGVASYALDTEADTPEVADVSHLSGIEAKAANIDKSLFDDLELAQAYADFGDSEAVAAILTCTRERSSKSSTPDFYDNAVRMVLRRRRQANHSRHLSAYLKAHPAGSEVDCRVVDSDSKRIFLVVNDDVPAIAFTRDAQESAFKKGSTIRAVIVRRIPNREGIAVSLRDKTTGQLLPRVGIPELHKKTQ